MKFKAYQESFWTLIGSTAHENPCDFLTRNTAPDPKTTRRLNRVYGWANLTHGQSTCGTSQFYPQVVNVSETDLDVAKSRIETLAKIGCFFPEFVVVTEDKDDFDDDIDLGEDYYVEPEPFDMEQAQDIHEYMQKAVKCRGRRSTET